MLMILAYYSTQIFVDAGFSITQALLVSMGTGIVNWLFAIPAIYTIDTFGRRNLLLTTFPIMALCLLFTGFSFYAPDTADEGSYNTTRVALIATGIYLFMAVYSPGEGPVPFTYSAEAFPLYIRDTGMSFATATCWGFNFIISFTWPALLGAFGPTGAFGWYAAWNAAATVYCYFLLPETKVSLPSIVTKGHRLIDQNLTLEELDVVFAIGNREHARYYKNKLPWYLRKYILRRKVEAYPALYQLGTGEAAQD
jgi:MFS family permease